MKKILIQTIFNRFIRNIIKKLIINRSTKNSNRKSINDIKKK